MIVRVQARVLGIDPGLQRTGYACVDGEGADRVVVREAGVLRLTRGASVAQRLAELKRDLDAVLDEWRPHVLAVEEVFSHHRHVRTAIIMGHARGVVLLCGAERGMRLAEFAPSRIKRAVTGRGNATKRQVQAAVVAHAGLAAPPEPPDVADAIAIAMTALVCDQPVLVRG